MGAAFGVENAEDLIGDFVLEILGGEIGQGRSAGGEIGSAARGWS